MISQGDVDTILDETLVNATLNVDVNIFAIIVDKFDFVTNIVKHEACVTENVPNDVLKEILDKVVVTKVTKLVVTSSAPLKRRTRSMADH
ncbi:hypothetical protein PVK06_011010 [Gossypium arboreum]|uniref:Uncharacterized protein n=1 Tax=Gossypium arboreum TaxID=29729 RepID=A0ABR0Q8F5_GOSAR|nr:hypothetical protein PVK06_011010 [Gossypium arboreum]